MNSGIYALMATTAALARHGLNLGRTDPRTTTTEGCNINSRHFDSGKRSRRRRRGARRSIK